MGKKALCSKICLVVILILINILAVILSIALIASGIALIVISNQTNLNLEPLIALVGVVFGLGMLFLVISILGIISSISSLPSRYAFRVFSTCAVSVYMAVLVLLILAEVGGMVAGIILRDQLARENTIEDIFDEFVRSYDVNDAFRAIIDGWQGTFMCCGYNSSSSWFANGTNFTSPDLPPSCCNTTITLSNQQCTVSVAFDQGCSQRLLSLVDESIGAVIGVFAGIIVFQIAIVAINLFLICCIWLDRGPSAAYRFRTGSVFALENSVAISH